LSSSKKWTDFIAKQKVKGTEKLAKVQKVVQKTFDPTLFFMNKPSDWQQKDKGEQETRKKNNTLS